MKFKPGDIVIERGNESGEFAFAFYRDKTLMGQKFDCMLLVPNGMKVVFPMSEWQEHDAKSSELWYAHGRHVLTEVR